MRRKGRIWTTICVAVIIAAAAIVWRHPPRAAIDALDDADRYELLSLDPDRSDSPSSDDFHGHHVLARLVVVDIAVQRQLNAALRAGIDSKQTMAACFNPRHGIRVTRAAQTTDFVICFECSQVKVWRGDRQVAYLATSSSPQATFDGVLLKANVPLAKR
ncbi:MAG TPA: hypothetical protein VFC46_03315 [Humisphaera sp.]|nr:hypothetical protein [Humisphaera sp.]